MSPTKFCLATLRYYPVFGGAALRFMRYLPGLKARDIDPVVFTGTPTAEWMEASEIDVSWRSAPAGTVLPVEMVEGTPVYRVRLSNADTRRRQFQYASALVRFCTDNGYRPAVIQHLSLRGSHIPWLIRMRRSHIPMVYTRTMVATPPSNPIKRAYRRQETRLRYQLMDRVVVSSSVVQNLIRDLNMTTPIDVIPNGVDLHRYRPAANRRERQQIRARYGVKVDDFLIVTIGAVEPRKGTDVMVEAWSRLASVLPQSHLLVIGPRKDISEPSLDTFRKKIETSIEKSRAKDRIHFTGRVDNVDEYLRAADLFIFASIKEGFGNAILEAMATGLTVVTTPFTGLPDEFGRPGEEYLIVERDAQTLSACMHDLLTNPMRRQTIGARARQWVERTMDIELSLDRYADMYHRLANHV